MPDLRRIPGGEADGFNSKRGEVQRSCPPITPPLTARTQLDTRRSTRWQSADDALHVHELAAADGPSRDI